MQLYDISKVLFAEGWFFFVPYLLFYLVFKYSHLKIYYLENIFVFLHLFNTLLFIYYSPDFSPLGTGRKLNGLLLKIGGFI